jgi:hypothetical protein
MKQFSAIPRFEVDYKQRLKQQREATNAVRLSCLGYSLYRVYDIEEAKDKNHLNGLYGQHIGRGIRKGPISISISSKNPYSLWKIIIDELETKVESPYTVKWLKPKHVTLLKLKGHTVEPAAMADKSTSKYKVQKPVNLGV